MINCGYFYYNGELGKLSDARIPLTDRAIYFAEAVYDVAIGQNGHVYQQKEHLKRLLFNANFVGLRCPEVSEIESAITSLIDLFGKGAFLLYLQLSGYGDIRDHSRRDESRSNLLVTVSQLSNPDYRSVALNSETDLRHSICNIKTTNLLCAASSSVRASKAGFDETVYIRDGYVTECSHSNFLMIRDGAIYSHPADNKILNGITKQNVERICKNEGIPFYERLFTLEEVIDSDGAVITSTTKFLRSVSSIDGIRLKQSPLSDKIFDKLYSEYNKILFVL